MNFSKEIKINDIKIGYENSTFIIAEAGVNHNGDMELAKKLIDLASDAGANAVKFQTFKAEHLILPKVDKAPYQKLTTEKTETQMEMLKKLEVSKSQNIELSNYCKKKNIIFLTTPFDEFSLSKLDDLNLPAYKIASTDITNLPFLKKVARKRKPIFLSTGMSYLSEIELALKTIYEFNKDVILLQCTANYPISDSEANLNVINTFKENFDILIGFSDHTVGVGAAPFSIPMGTCLIEKHFTLDKTQEGPDQMASLSPDELIEFVKVVRKVDQYMGTNLKTPNLSETKTRVSLQKCLVASKKIKKGELFSEDNVVAKRTGGFGISPIYYEEVFGKESDKDYLENDIILL